MGDARSRIVILAACGIAGAGALGGPTARANQATRPSPTESAVTAAKALSEATKKQIYWDAFSIEHKAVRAADQRYPIDFSAADALQQLKVNGDYADTLIAKDESALQRKYGITKDQYQKIVVEGVARKWPKPSSQP